MILKSKMLLLQKFAFNDVSPSCGFVSNSGVVSSTATMSPMRRDVSCEALQMDSSIRVVKLFSLLQSIEYMLASFLSTSNLFSAFSKTTGLYSGAGSRDVWSAHEAYASPCSGLQ